MHQTLRVGRVQRRRDLGDHGDRRLRPHGAIAVQQGSRVGAVDQAHIQVEVAFDFAVAVNRDHMWFAQLCGVVSLASEALPEVGVDGAAFGQQFDRHNAVGSGVVGPPYLAHAALTDQLVQPVAAERYAVHRPPPARMNRVRYGGSVS